MHPLPQNTSFPRARLLKTRIQHSRIFVFFIVALIIVSGTQVSGHAAAIKVMQWSGYALVILGVLIRVYSSLFIGGRKNDQLVTDGPFSVARNPLYAGSFIAIVGIGLQSTSLLILLMLVAAFMLYYPLVIQREEAFLAEKFGDAYHRYADTTPRMIPDRKLWHCSQELMCKPYNVLRTMLDGLMFFLPLPLLDALTALHAHGELPTLWVLP